MKTALLTSLIITILLRTSGPSDWRKDRPVSGFNGLSVTSGIEVYLTQGNSEKLTLDVKGLTEDEVRSEVRNGVLKLSIDRRGMGGWQRNNNSVKAYLTFRQLRDISASAGADVRGQNTMSFDELNLAVSSGAELTMNLKATDLNASVSSGAEATLEGAARTFNCQSASGADFNARKLVAETCAAVSSGGADLSVNASRELTMKASGGADIHYYGNARVTGKSESGGGDITQGNR